MVLKKVQIPSNYSTDLLSDMLVLPRPADDGPTCKRKQKSVNSKAVCITDDEVLEQLKEKAAEKAEAEREKNKGGKRNSFWQNEGRKSRQKSS